MISSGKNSFSFLKDVMSAERRFF